MPLRVFSMLAFVSVAVVPFVHWSDLPLCTDEAIVPEAYTTSDASPALPPTSHGRS
jgi:hypothetical protein